MPGRVVSLSIKPRTPGERGLPKGVVASLEIRATGAVGDFNNYRSHELHGDTDCALLLLTEDILGELREQGWPVEPGHLGENALIAGIGNSELRPGLAVRLGEARVQISKACDPCTELYVLGYVGKTRGPEFIRALHGRRGWYARVLEEGTVASGDPVHLVPAGD